MYIIHKFKMYEYKRAECSPSNKYNEFISKKEILEIVQNNKIIKFYRILFGLQITIILIYYIYNLCVWCHN